MNTRILHLKTRRTLRNWGGLALLLGLVLALCGCEPGSEIQRPTTVHYFNI